MITLTVLAKPVVLSPAVLFLDVTMLVTTVTEDEGAPVLKAGRAGVVVLAAPVVLLETAREADVEMLDGKGVDVPEAAALLDDIATTVLEMIALEDATMLMPKASGAGVVVLITLVVPDDDVTAAILVPIVDDDNLLLVEVPNVAGVDVVSTPVALDDDTIVMFMLVVVNDANLLLLEAAGTGVEVLGRKSVEVCTTPAVLDDANPVVLSPAVLLLNVTMLVANITEDEGAPIKVAREAYDDTFFVLMFVVVEDDGDLV